MKDFIQYSDLTYEDKKAIRNEYYKKPYLSFKSLATKFNISKYTLRKILNVDFMINTNLKNRYTLNSNYFDDIDSEPKAYLLGLLTADGYVGTEKYSNIVFESRDIELVEYLKKEISYTGEIKITTPGGYKNSTSGYKISFSDKNMANKLRDYGIVPFRKQDLLTMPIIPDGLIRHYIRGYIDGDGTISKSVSHSVYHEKEYFYDQLILSIIGPMDFLNDIIRTVNIEKYSFQKSKTEYLFYLKIYSKAEVNKLYKYFYDNITICLNRKRQIWDDYLGANSQK